MACSCPDASEDAAEEAEEVEVAAVAAEEEEGCAVRRRLEADRLETVLAAVALAVGVDALRLREGAV